MSTRFWSGDERSPYWPDEIKLGSLYFLTCSHRTLEGIYLLPLQYASADLRWPMKKVSKTIAFLTDQGFLHFDVNTNTLLIRNALKYQAPENENQAKSCLRRISNLPKTALLQEFLSLAKQHCYRKGASPYAQTFYQLLEQQLTQLLAQRLGQPVGTLNLPSPSSPMPKNSISHLQPRLAGDKEGDPSFFSLSEEERREEAIRKRWPQYADVESK